MRVAEEVVSSTSHSLNGNTLTQLGRSVDYSDSTQRFMFAVLFEKISKRFREGPSVPPGSVRTILDSIQADFVEDDISLQVFLFFVNSRKCAVICEALEQFPADKRLSQVCTEAVNGWLSVLSVVYPPPERDSAATIDFDLEMMTHLKVHCPEINDFLVRRLPRQLQQEPTYIDLFSVRSPEARKFLGRQ